MRVSIPDAWKRLKTEDFEYFIKLLDPEHVGFVELWKIFLFAIMNNFSLPTASKIEDYKLALTNFNDTVTKLEKSVILTSEAWFDSE